MAQFLKSKWKAGCMIALFYLINFGLWELIAPVISDEWASFAVEVLLLGWVHSSALTSCPGITRM